MTRLAIALALVGCAPSRSPASPHTAATPSAATPAAKKPAQALALAPAHRFSAGGVYTCFVDDVGRVLCWGDARGTEPGVPTLVEGLPPVVEVAAGYDSACARTQGGDVWCWNERDDPALVEGLREAVEIAAGATIHCARQRDHATLCWGAIMPGFETYYPPHRVTGLVEPTDIAAGHYEACGIDKDKKAVCFGEMGRMADLSTYPADSVHSGEVLGQTWVRTSIVAPKHKNKGFIESRADYDKCHAELLDEHPRLRGHVIVRVAYPRNDAGTVTTKVLEHAFDGDVGERIAQCVAAALRDRRSRRDPGAEIDLKIEFDHTLTRVLTARAIAEDATSIDLEGYLGCVTTSAGHLVCWGHSYDEQLDLVRPGRIENIEHAVEVAIGFSHVCVRHDDGSLTCLGSNRVGALGGPPPYDDEHHVVRLDVKGVRHVFAAANHTCAMLDPPELRCWGYAGDGSLGRGAGEKAPAAPAPVVGLDLPARW